MIISEKVELEILSEVSKIANSTQDFGVKLDNIVRVIAEKLSRDVCYIVLRDKDRDVLVLKAAVGLNPDSIDRVMLRMGEGVSGWVVAAQGGRGAGTRKPGPEVQAGAADG